jgi:hypothetical protein
VTVGIRANGSSKKFSKKKFPNIFPTIRFGCAEAMGAARFSLSHAWMKEIEERSKSIDAILARISHIQASWAPAEQIVREGMERSGDSSLQQREAPVQALARISSLKSFTPVSSTAIHHTMKTETDTTMDAHKVFGEMSTQHEVTMSSVIHVSVSHVLYPVIEDVL